MDIMTVNKVVPKLRFKEFSENWIQSAFSEISKEFSYGTGSAATKYDGENKYLRITDIDDETRMFKPNPLTSPNCIIQDKYKLEEDDIVFARTGASVGKSYLYNNCDGNLIYAGFLIKMSVNSADSSFIFYETLREKYYKWVSVYSVRSGQPGLNAEELKSYKLYLPNLIEQKKIASFLSAVDEKLQQLSKKKELLEDYKKGIMQKIFSQEIRFKNDDGSEYPNWQQKSLGDVCEIIVGGTPSTVKKEYWNGDIGWLNSGAMNNGNVFKPSNYITRLGLKNSSAKMMTTNTVMLAMTGATLGKIGYLQFPCSGNQSIAGFLPNQSYNSKFLFYTLQMGVNQVFKFAGGAAQKGINKQSICNLKYDFPKKEEQKKVGKFLSAIDRKIELVNNQLEKTKEFKEGLLQQMFV